MLPDDTTTEMDVISTYKVEDSTVVPDETSADSDTFPSSRTEDPDNPSTSDDLGATTVKDSNNDLAVKICVNISDLIFQAAHPTNCAKFLFCNRGRVTIMNCPVGLWYDPYRRICDFPKNVNCVSQTH